VIFLGAMRASLDCRSFEGFSRNLWVFSLLIMPHKLTPKPLAEVARELNVDAVVDRSVLHAGDLFASPPN
jgi:hypothetical protein